MLPNTLNVVGVEERRGMGATGHWQVYMEKPDGTLHAHAMPKTTLVARSIEYGIPEDDEETLWDIVIHEPFMADPSDNFALARWGDPAASIGLEGVTCYTAPTLQHGLAAHRARIEHCKSEIVVVKDRRALRRPVLSHREHWQTCAFLEDRFWSERRNVLREARRAAANR